MKLIKSVAAATIIACTIQNPVALAADKTFPLAKTVIGLHAATSIKGEYIVVFEDDTKASVINELARTMLGGGKDASLSLSSPKLLTSINALVGKMSNVQIEELRRNPQVKSIETNRIIQGAKQPPAMPMMRGATDSWGVDRLDQASLPLDGQFNPNGNGSGVNAYIIDTGILTEHLQFEGRAHWAFTASDIADGDNDLHGHGTSMAGNVGSNAWGVANQAWLYAVKVRDGSGTGTLAGLIEGINYVTNNHQAPAVAVIGTSVYDSPALNAAVSASINAGVVYSVPAGDVIRDACNYSPGNLTEAITVSATSQADGASPYSNFGSCVDVFAPGLYVKSAWHTGNFHNNTQSHTPTSAALVAGAAAVVLGNDNACSPQQVRQRIIDNANLGALANMPANTENRLLHVPSAASTESCAPSGGSGESSGELPSQGPITMTGVIYNTNAAGDSVCMALADEGSNSTVVAAVCDANAPKWIVRDDGRVQYANQINGQDMCLDADLGHPYNNNKLMVWNCSGLASNQTFTQQVTGVVSLNANGRCVNNNGIGQQMTTAGCDVNNQVFQIKPNEGKIYLLSSSSNQCLGLTGTPNAGVGITTVDCGTAPFWRVADVTKLLNSEATQIQLVDDNVNICIDNDTANPYYNHLVQTYHCWGSSVNNNWRWDGHGVIIHNTRNLCLAPTANPAINGEQAVMAGCNLNTQSWELRPF